MSVMSDDIARRARVRQIDLTPWAKAVAGDLSTVTLPDGYRLMGDARRATGPYRLRLLRANVEIAEQWVAAAKDVPMWLQVLADLAALDLREQERRIERETEARGMAADALRSERYTVTVGPGDWIEDISDE